MKIINSNICTINLISIERLILSSTNENDLILDMFNGSGTTGVVSIRNKRGYIGIESENDYYTITKKRLNRELK